MEQKYFSKKETAVILGVHPRTVERYLLAGMLNGARLGKEWKVSQGDIEAFYEDAKAKTKKNLSERQIGTDTDAPDHNTNAKSARTASAGKKSAQTKNE